MKPASYNNRNRNGKQNETEWNGTEHFSFNARILAKTLYVIYSGMEHGRMAMLNGWIINTDKRLYKFLTTIITSVLDLCACAKYISAENSPKFNTIKVSDIYDTIHDIIINFNHTWL